MGWIRSLPGLCLVVAFGAADAQPKKLPALEGATESLKLTTPSGFIDDAVGVDNERLVYVVADTSSKAELHVVTLATKAEQVVDVSALTLHPLAVHLIGPRALVIGEVEGGKQMGALVELADKGRVKAGTAVYKIAPATHITYLGKRGVAVHRVTTTANSTRHEVELVSADRGRRIGAMRVMVLGPGDVEKKMDFRVNHWSDGWTRAHGIKGGEWNRKENQRSPDTEATYDVLSGKLLDRQKITDLFEQRKRFQTLADAGGQLDFVRFSWDNKALQVWRGGVLGKLELDQPLSTYDPKSLQSVVTPDGLWIALKVDPVNVEAVARKKADPEYLDIFRAGLDGKAIRKARILAPGMRHRFGAMADGKGFWLVERNQSMDRGGKSLTVYQLP